MPAQGKTPLSDKEKAALSVVMAIGETIKDLGHVPSGHLYAQVMGRLSLDQYNKVIDLLKKVGAVKEENHVLTWIGG